MTKQELTEMLKEKGLCAWQLAELLGISDSYYTKKIRHLETDTELQKQIKEVLDNV